MIDVPDDEDDDVVAASSSSALDTSRSSTRQVAKVHPFPSATDEATSDLTSDALGLTQYPLDVADQAASSSADAGNAPPMLFGLRLAKFAVDPSEVVPLTPAASASTSALGSWHHTDESSSPAPPSAPVRALPRIAKTKVKLVDRTFILTSFSLDNGSPVLGEISYGVLLIGESRETKTKLFLHASRVKLLPPTAISVSE